MRAFSSHTIAHPPPVSSCPSLSPPLPRTSATPPPPKGGMRAFYAAQMRFFRQLCTAAKVDAVVELALSYEANGYAPVIGLQSTGEARTAAYVAAHGGDDETLDSFVEPAALVLANWIEKWLPGAQGEGGGGGL